MMQRPISRLKAGSLTAAKFKPLITSVCGFVSAYVEDILLFVILHGFRLLLA
jgi:hypothetical protein